MKALIITYYWPPAGGSGVQRWLKFVKYLPYHGITPIVFVPRNVDYSVIDDELITETKGVEVISQSFLDVQKFTRVKKKKGGDANVSSGGVLSWIRGNFFIPDSKILWVKPSVKYLTNYLKNNDVDIVISTGPPHSVHLIANELKKKFALKWVADFRDPWTDLYYLNDFKLNKYSRKKNKKLELEVLTNADTIVTVSNFLKQELSLKTNKPVKVITNGYDDEFVEDEVLLSEKFSISYIGLLPKQSNSDSLWEVLRELKDEEQQFKNDLEIVLVGNICNEAISCIKKNQLEENLKLVGYVSHSESVKLQRSAQVLLLLIPKTRGAKGIITGKVFEYLKAKRPILAVGPEDGDLAEILTKTNSGTIIDFGDKEKMKEEIKKLYIEYKTKKLTTISNNIKQYHRRELTSQLASLLKQMINS
ncbi:glycosyltransferase [Tenacibaculum sp. FZY0031]|uniref:glycosyltransferase n=1 Tax=Tenacibaculum sp. FZY0031 TaxID=3116648 RepID=UPI002EB3D2B3|nr:glycosyltransferase [Tenacibaculum sp. FZY0031]